MIFTDSERLIVLMLSEVMEAMGLTDELDPALIRKLVVNRHDWAIKHRYPGIFDGNEAADPIVKETIDILWMWGIIEHSISQLVGRDHTEASGWRLCRFNGFDGNHDDHFHVANTLIYDLKMFDDFKDRDLNSHSQASLPRYRRMYAKFGEYVGKSEASPLSIEALRDIFGNQQ